MNLLRTQSNYADSSFRDLNSEQLPIFDVNEFIPSIGKWITVAGSVMISIVVLGVTLASILKYNVTVKVPATIRPLGELKIVESAITGTVLKIDAKDNQIVKQGQAIAYVDDSQLQNQKSQQQSSIQKGKLQLSQIDAQLSEINLQLAAQTELMNRTILAAQAELSGTERNYQDQRIKAFAEMTQAQTALTLAKLQKDRLRREKLLTTTVQETEAALSLARVQRDRLQREKLIQSTVQAAETALKIAQQQKDRLQRDQLLTVTVQEAEAALQMAKLQRDRLQSIVALGAVPLNLFEEKAQAVKEAEAKLVQTKANTKNLLEDKEQAVISAQAKLAQAQENAKNSLEEKVQAVKVAETKLEQAKANAKDSLEEKDQALTIAETNLIKVKTALNPSDSPVAVASARIQQEQAKKAADIAALKKERETLLQQRTEFHKQLDSTQKQLQQTENDLSKTVIRAPSEGILLQFKLRNPGQIVQPSEAIAQIAPLDAPLQIKARVPAQDIDKVKANQQVQMQISACPYPDYGTLQGTVTTIAPDALAVQKNVTSPTLQPAPAYEVTIVPQTSFVGRGDRQCHLKPGMEGRADIISRQETVMQFILRKARFIADI
ncbi:HlyD family efflux transporter periplasmic adaptor subunit [Nostoc sp. LEGE 06077]|uniref:HlyD family efflux transporter periplasmic adaptor subunit n=1 Tax=Nostoc sp. LEGE 06077 TaxID=915325 RepID=UPI001882CFCA|nr:HlyD family efflux transporter periplasmic adaptor subunit [Nostoc sp. LEGE 06077]